MAYLLNSSFAACVLGCFFLNFIFISERHINNLSNLAVIHIVVTLMSFSLNLEKARRKNELHFYFSFIFCSWAR